MERAGPGVWFHGPETGTGGARALSRQLDHRDARRQSERPWHGKHALHRRLAGEHDGIREPQEVLNRRPAQQSGLVALLEVEERGPRNLQKPLGQAWLLSDPAAADKQRAAPVALAREGRGQVGKTPHVCHLETLTQLRSPDREHVPGHAAEFGRIGNVEALEVLAEEFGKRVDDGLRENRKRLLIDGSGPLDKLLGQHDLAHLEGILPQEEHGEPPAAQRLQHHQGGIRRKDLLRLDRVPGDRHDKPAQRGMLRDFHDPPIYFLTCCTDRLRHGGSFSPVRQHVARRSTGLISQMPDPVLCRFQAIDQLSKLTVCQGCPRAVGSPGQLH